MKELGKTEQGCSILQQIGSKRLRRRLMIEQFDATKPAGLRHSETSNLRGTCADGRDAGAIAMSQYESAA